MMKSRQQTMPKYGTEYSTLHKEIRNKCRQVDKRGMDQWKVCKVERISITDKADIAKRIRV